MKRIILTTLTSLVIAASAQHVFAEGTNNVDISAEVTSAATQLEEKFKAGKTTAADMAANLKAINALIVKHQKGEDREQLAKLYLLLARIHADALNNGPRALAILNQVKRDFAGTQAAAYANTRAGELKAKIAAEEAATPEGLEIGKRFPGFSETDVAGKPLSIAAYRGKVVLVDFWATWCGPCVAEMPNVIAAYRKYQPAGFEIVGVSLDNNRDKLLNFTRAQGMAWPQFFDGQGWDNKLANKYDVHSIPATYLLDNRGRIIGKNLRGRKLEEALIKALANN